MATTTQIPKTPPAPAPAPAPAAVPVRTTTNVRSALMRQTRYRLLILGVVGFVLALITLLQAIHAYNTSYDLLNGIVAQNSTTVDASENALQDIAQTSQSAADYAVLDTGTPLYEAAQTNIFRSFANFRDELFTLRNNLQTDEERTAFTTAETFTYSSFWRYISDLVANRAVAAIPERAYLEADNHVLSWINPALQDLESLNFQQMVDAGNAAGGIIITQVVLLAIPALLLALLLTYLSLMVRGKVHRYFTPGIDIALGLAWIVLVVMLINLLTAPGQIDGMIQNYYLNVSASSRVLVDANLANRAESSEILDTERVDAWNTRFDQAVQRVELRLCGQPGCLSNSFAPSNSDEPTEQVVESAQAITPQNSAQIDGITPLMANVTVPTMATMLEQARVAFQNFRSVDTKLRTLITSNKIPDAITLNTDVSDGTSQQAFNQFATAMTSVRDMNHQAFDLNAEALSETLQNNRVLLGLVGYLAIAVLIVVGVYHRYREL